VVEYAGRPEPGSALDRLQKTGALFDEQPAIRPGGSRAQTSRGRQNGILIGATGWDQNDWAAPIRAREPGRGLWLWPDVPDRAAVGYALLWRPQAGVFEGLANLQVIFSLGAGVDALVERDDLPAGVPVVRIVDPDLTQRMTEWVVLQVLMHHRSQRRYDVAQAAHRWQVIAQPTAPEVRVGIMGMGVFGQAAAKALVDLGYDVAGWSGSRHAIPGVRSFAGRDELAAFLGRTDILVSLLPLTPQTHAILSMPLFRHLARNGKFGPPVLINAGRGGLQVESDIVAALDAGILAGASLDVFEREPLDAASPLWDRPNVIITPHASANSYPAALVPGILAQIAAFERGEPLQNVVDRARGY
jgi:glyoxylate/hydroxypyruvate reductase A